MIVRYDRKADILYLRFSEEKPVDTEMVDDDVVVALNRKGELVSMEIWRAKELILPAFLRYLREIREVVK
jgi:uncharacterized protein YuzE